MLFGKLWSTSREWLNSSFDEKEKKSSKCFLFLNEKQSSPMTDVILLGGRGSRLHGDPCDYGHPRNWICLWIRIFLGRLMQNPDAVTEALKLRYHSFSCSCNFFCFYDPNHFFLSRVAKSDLSKLCSGLFHGKDQTGLVVCGICSRKLQKSKGLAQAISTMRGCTLDNLYTNAFIAGTNRRRNPGTTS